ncbi:hypothetical protein [Nocardioides iriomotensis]|uniref:Uncharacterized protein n=1 Tax=Nocardioides iriomotensis TaxID=715784 RepID=A0A4Q5J7S9_9ACTN|nr:hypothetical protein [Nocardioides iriomotensis]RYU13948.1 hypothetical protein ETU37_05360 [Nocardioides iriomotensis]
MDLSGVIFAVLALAWAVYLIPKALKHHDEVARTRSVDRFSPAARVLARREPVSRRDSRLVVPSGRADGEDRPSAPARPVDPRAARAARRAAKAAARRRRRVLAFLLVCTAVVAGLAAFAVVPWWSVTIPAALVLLWLVLCRTQVRQARNARWEADLADAIEQEEAVRPGRPAAHAEAPAVRNAQGFEEVAPEEDTIAIPVAVLDAVMVPTEDGGSLWDPLPVTLPTYVTKPKARRTVRTIDLDEPGSWTSGRSDQDSALVAEAQAQAEQTAAEEAPVEQQRAVGS